MLVPRIHPAFRGAALFREGASREQGRSDCPGRRSAHGVPLSPPVLLPLSVLGDPRVSLAVAFPPSSSDWQQVPPAPSGPVWGGGSSQGRSDRGSLNQARDDVYLQLHLVAERTPSTNPLAEISDTVRAWGCEGVIVPVCV